MVAIDPSARVRASRPFLSTSQAAALAETTNATLVRWCRDGVLPAKKVVGRWRIERRDLDRLLAAKPDDAAA